MNLTSRTHDSFSSIDPEQWRGLNRHDNPFLSWRFLNALEESGCVSAKAGWQPHHLCVYQGDRLLGCAPSYLKSHSRGEFVFDWAWADAYQRHGMEYYPKLLTAIPFSPITGPRLLVHDNIARRGHGPDAAQIRNQLVTDAVQCCEVQNHSSWHCNFMHETDLDAAAGSGLLRRSDWQFHWLNRGYGSFADFLGALRAKKRKNIRHERRDVGRAGICFVRLHGNDLTPNDIDFVFNCYQQTFYEHGNYAALNRAFFEQLARTMADQLLVVMARYMDEPIAMGLFLQGGKRLYGRYWGAIRRVPSLHFETAYYQGIEYCIDQGLEVFESGAQGEHKISRGFSPVRTHSRHLIRHPEFRAAISAYLKEEERWLTNYGHALKQRSPYLIAGPA